MSFGSGECVTGLKNKAKARAKIKELLRGGLKKGAAAKLEEANEDNDT
eukprot:CAMPEP_0197718234 /NCGR_PEP_ID=MMETSP1434-20131217/2471_1 /TAXON_ID=265543 /ORGANISM="Minutocellus polymorphus, Strain CCMP3303" /LENGTH=47 /DNA_ID= /DNA_START= /DNA_END= /DNA_ORIENTATION=